MKKVSVIIPTYNRADILMESVNSVLQQTYSNIEVIIVDDGSTDNTREVVEAISDERVKYIELSQNVGAAGARNIGVQYAESEIIAFEDSDDIWKIDKLEKQMDYWKEHPEFAMIYCPYYMHMPEGCCRVPDRDWNGEFEGDIFLGLLIRNTVGTPTILMYKDAFLEVGGFDTTLRSLEDWDFAVRFAKEYMIGYLDEVLVDAFSSEGGVSSEKGAYYESRCKMLVAYKDVMQKYGIFDIVVSDLFQRAQGSNALEMVKKMLLLLLTESSQQK